MRCIPYFLIVAAGVGYGIAGQASTSEAGLDVSGPARRVCAGSPENEALRMVYEYRPSGRDQDVLDMLGTKEDALGPSPWQTECDQDNRCDVSSISRDAGDGEPLYEFSVDLGAKSVTPSEMTEQRLLEEPAPQIQG